MTRIDKVIVWAAVKSLWIDGRNIIQYKLILFDVALMIVATLIISVHEHWIDLAS